MTHCQPVNRNGFTFCTNSRRFNCSFIANNIYYSLLFAYITKYFVFRPTYTSEDTAAHCLKQPHHKNRKNGSSFLRHQLICTDRKLIRHDFPTERSTADVCYHMCFEQFREFQYVSTHWKPHHTPF